MRPYVHTYFIDFPHGGFSKMLKKNNPQIIMTKIRFYKCKSNNSLSPQAIVKNSDWITQFERII